MSTRAPSFDETPLNPDLTGVRLDDQVRKHSPISIRAVLWNKSQRHAAPANKSLERIVCSDGGQPLRSRSPRSGISGARSQGTDESHLHAVIKENGLAVYRASDGSGWAGL
jgi:hypothetical protein